MPIWLIILISFLAWSIWPGIIVALHISEERRVKKHESKGDKFMQKLKEDENEKFM